MSSSARPDSRDPPTDGIMVDSEMQPTSPYQQLPEPGKEGATSWQGSFQSLGLDKEPPAPVSGTESSPGYLFNLSRKTLVQMCYLSMGGILGSLLRIILAQLFGEECANPGTVGWLKAGSPLCVTDNGGVEAEGGIVFADLPANLLGSFLMGFMQNGKDLGLAIHLPIAWLSPTHSGQSMDVLHLAFKTGFCGSLTTFSSWNSSMVVLMFGTGYNRASQFWSALFGYVIGMETALGSFVFGKTVAKWLHGWINPTLAQEAIAMKEREEEGMHINRDLPEYERRFLHELNLEDMGHVFPEERVHLLELWRSSTKEARRIRHPLLPSLIEIETALLANEWQLSPHAESVANAENWQLRSLREWIYLKNGDMSRLPSISSSGVLLPPQEPTKLFKLSAAASILASTFVVLIICICLMSEESPYVITHRTMVYSMIWAPLGVLLRWNLSSFNGKFPEPGYEWFPLGTLMANLIGSIVSIIMIAVEYRVIGGGGGLMMGTQITLRAIKVGFAGSLTTVSTFVSEVHHLMSPIQARGYTYTFVTLSSACIISVILFAWILYLT